MMADVREAEDATQAILIKMITGLAGYDPERGAFRTWLYRIAANHVINMQRRGAERMMTALADGEDMQALIEELPDPRPTALPEHDILVREARMSCLNGILLCLDRRHRLVFILGVIFAVPDSVGSEILGISKVNFRKMLSRARERIGNFLNRQCGLVDPRNPCRCSRTVDVQMKMGLLKPGKISATEIPVSVVEILPAEARRFEEGYYSQFIALYRQGPFFEGPDLTAWLQSLLESRECQDPFQLP